MPLTSVCCYQAHRHTLSHTGPKAVCFKDLPIRLSTHGEGLNSGIMLLAYTLTTFNLPFNKESTLPYSE